MQHDNVAAGNQDRFEIGQLLLELGDLLGKQRVASRRCIALSKRPWILPTWRRWCRSSARSCEIAWRRSAATTAVSPSVRRVCARCDHELPQAQAVQALLLLESFLAQSIGFVQRLCRR